MEARLRPVVSQWRLCTDFDLQQSDALLMMENATLTEGAVFNKATPVFAVASTVMFCGSNRQNARVDGEH